MNGWHWHEGWLRALPAVLALGCTPPAGGDGGTDPETGDGSESSGSETSGGSSSDESGEEESGTQTGDLPACGDGHIDDGEQCDDGAQNGEYGACAADCSGEGPHCGDAVIDGPEECDDGNDDGLDGCSNACVASSCGDDVATPGELCFSPAEELLLTEDPGPLALVDLDGDNHLDLVVGDVLGGEVRVAIGDGAGGLISGPALAGPELVHDLALADFDGDANLDVLAVGRTDGYVILLGDGLGGLSVAASSDEPLRSATARDVDADGKADLLVGLDGATHLRLGAGDGTFTPHASLAHAGWACDWSIATDLDGDLEPDFVVALDESGAFEPAGELRVWVGQGGGAFAPGQDFGLADDADRLLASDLDGDALPDLIALRGGQPCEGANKKCAGVNWLHPTLGEVTTYVSDAQDPGALALESSLVIGFDPSDMAIDDLDRDGHQDLVVAHFAYGWLELLRGHGDGAFTTEVVEAVGFRHVDIELGDLDEDGVPDIVMSRAALGEDAGAVRIKLSNP